MQESAVGNFEKFAIILKLYFTLNAHAWQSCWALGFLIEDSHNLQNYPLLHTHFSFVRCEMVFDLSARSYRYSMVGVSSGSADPPSAPRELTLRSRESTYSMEVTSNVHLKSKIKSCILVCIVLWFTGLSRIRCGLWKDDLPGAINNFQANDVFCVGSNTQSAIKIATGLIGRAINVVKSKSSNSNQVPHGEWYTNIYRVWKE